MSMDLVPLRDLVLEVTPGFASGAHNSEGTGIPHLRPMNVDSRGKIALETVKSVEPDVNSRRLTTGDVLFNNTNSPDLVGKTALFALPGEYAFSNHMTRIRVNYDLLDPAFLSSFLHSKWMDGTFKRLCSNHVNQASISRAVLQGLDVPVPPLDKQRRIVAELEDQLGRLDATSTQLAETKTQLEQLRASALNQQFGSGTQRMSVDLIPLGEVVSVGRRRPAALRLSTDEVSMVPMAAVGEESGKLDASGRITHKAAQAKTLTYFEDGDVIFAKVTPCMENGKIAVAKGLHNGSAYGSTEFHVLVPSEKIDAEYLALFLVRRDFRASAQMSMTGAVGLRRVPKSFLEEAIIPLPLLEDQKRIVAELEDQLGRLDATHTQLAKVDALVDSARASMLHRAFSGGRDD